MAAFRGKTLWFSALALWLAAGPADAVVSDDKAWAYDVVHSHIAENYAWAKSDYRLRIRYEKDGVVALYVHHMDDERRSSQGTIWAGGGKSFELYLDAATHSVVKELHFQ
ncbi:MAG: hypothetical protein ACFCUT_00970 [Kiloniellaceae bacterium]